LKELLNLKRYLIFMLKGTQAEMKQANCFNWWADAGSGYCSKARSLW
jgi:hypothetical protein